MNTNLILSSVHFIIIAFSFLGFFLPFTQCISQDLMLCQEEFHPFQILFIPGIYCHLLDQELLSFPLLSSPINQIYYFMFIFFLFTSGVFWKSIHFEVASDSFSLLINSSWLLVFAIILFVLIFPYIFYLNILHFSIFFSYHFWCRDLLIYFRL